MEGGTVTIEFFVPGEPQGKARARTYLPRGSNKFRSVTPDKTRLYEARIRLSSVKIVVSREK